MQGSHVMAMLEGLPNVDNRTHATVAHLSVWAILQADVIGGLVPVSNPHDSHLPDKVWCSASMQRQ